MCDSHYKSRKETPNPLHEKHKKRLRKSPKRKTGEASRTLEESRQTFYTYHERFIQGLAYLLNIHPSLKISP
jgi:ACT domain-containing protein